MKKIISLILAIGSISVLMAASPTLATIDNMEFQLVAASTGTTTATGTAAATIFTKQIIEPGWSYVLTAYDSIGAAADSAHFGVVVYGSNNTTAMYTADFGSALTATTADSYLLPVGVTAFGKSMSVTFTRQNATNVSKVYRWELYKVRKNSIEQSWNQKR